MFDIQFKKIRPPTTSSAQSEKNQQKNGFILAKFRFVIQNFSVHFTGRADCGVLGLMRVGMVVLFKNSFHLEKSHFVSN